MQKLRLEVAKLHKEQTDLTKEPYIYHLLRVEHFSSIIINNINKHPDFNINDNLKEMVRITSLLHDSIEDCAHLMDDIDEHLKRIIYKNTNIKDDHDINIIIQSIKLLTKDENDKENYIAHLLKLNEYKNNSNINPFDDLSLKIAIIVKYADTLDNMNYVRLSKINKFKHLDIHYDSSNRHESQKYIELFENELLKNDNVKYLNRLEKYIHNLEILDKAFKFVLLESFQNHNYYNEISELINNPSQIEKSSIFKHIYSNIFTSVKLDIFKNKDNQFLLKNNDISVYNLDQLLLNNINNKKVKHNKLS